MIKQVDKLELIQNELPYKIYARDKDNNLIKAWEFDNRIDLYEAYNGIAEEFGEELKRRYEATRVSKTSN